MAWLWQSAPAISAAAARVHLALRRRARQLEVVDEYGHRAAGLAHLNRGAAGPVEVAGQDVARADHAARDPLENCDTFRRIDEDLVAAPLGALDLAADEGIGDQRAAV